MLHQNLYLKSNIAPRPILNSWPLWPALIPPTWAAMIVTKKHIPIMESYIADPKIHADAAKTPSLIGGPWIDYPAPRVDYIKRLLEKTKRDQSVLMELAAAIQTLEDLLRQEAKGLSLEQLYPSVPQALRGFVELVYDTDHRPGIRYMEGLMYRSRCYNRTLHEVALTPISQDSRPYERSTPLFDDGTFFRLDMSFDDERLDKLLSMETIAHPASEIMDELGIKEPERDSFMTLLTPQMPITRHRRPAAGEVRVRYFGHASLAIETRDLCIVVDPFLSYEYTTSLTRYTLHDLPETIDYVLITHGHNDHARPETLLRLRHRVRQVVVPRSAGRRLQDPSLKLILEHLGFKNVIELGDLEAIDVPSGVITGIPFLGEHSDMDIQAKSAFHIELYGRTVLCLADSCNLDRVLYQHIGRIFGRPDMLFIGMECEGAPLSWYYGMLHSRAIDRAIDQSRRDKGSNCAQALALVEDLKPRQAYVYAMGQEPWLNHVMGINQSGSHMGIAESSRFVAECERLGIESERLYGIKEITLHRL